MSTRISLFSFLLLVTVSVSAAQEFSLGSDFVSRYVWRGTDFGESLSMQPALEFSFGGLTVGSWASYSIAPEGAGANEHDLYLSYSFESETAGSFSVGVTDYYFPSPGGLDFFEFDGDGEGAHWIEPFVSYTGPAAAPITLTAAMFAHNDPDNSLFVSAAIPASVEGVGLEFVVGAVAGESAFYGTDGFAFVQSSIAVSKEIPLSERFSIPVSVSYILNPDAERTFLVFGISL